jgi:hypothetical protein
VFEAKMVLDSISPGRRRLMSITATYPRFIHAEIMTHRDRARNAASSRAIPWKRMKKGIEKVIPTVTGMQLNLDAEYYIDNCMYSMVMRDPVVPIYLGKEQQGMQAGDELEGEDREACIQDIIDMRNFCMERVNRMAQRGLHKSICNRYVEPWMWITVLMTATSWRNFFRLRCHPAAERHFQKIAGMIKDVINNSTPRQLRVGEWHCPYTEDQNEIPSVITPDLELIKRISAARSARLSFLTHEGIRDESKDLKLAATLIERDDDVIHASPLEHVAECMEDVNFRSGPFRGWKQFRKEFSNENVDDELGHYQY